MIARARTSSVAADQSHNARTSLHRRGLFDGDMSDDVPMMRLEIGPVGAEAARCWLAHVIGGFEVVRAKQELLPFRLPEEVADDIAKLLATWHDVAEVADGEFHWEGVLEEAEVRTLVQYWANLDSMSDDLVRQLGVDWTPAPGRPFFVALTTAVATALADLEGGPDPFAELLVGRNDDEVRSVRPV